MELNNMLFYEGLRTLIGPVLSLHYRMKSEGDYNVPPDSAAILVSNHRCLLDPFVLGYSVSRFINFAAAAYSWDIPGSRQLYQWAGAFPLSISGGSKSDKHLRRAYDLLSQGELIGIFPEGIESFMNPERVSKIASFKTGFVKMALDNRVPVIPAAVISLEERLLPKVPGSVVGAFVKHPRAKEGIRFITYKRVKCRVGKPIDLSPFYEEPVTKSLMDHIAGRVRRIVIKLYDGEDLDRFLTGETSYDLATVKV